ncbi:MAG: TfoX/Sxy family protein [Cardiobacteriaceae bacterium]|nr:TfoX/Sxy family protein [Cardiobacteriaceae bacterium]
MARDYGLEEILHEDLEDLADLRTKTMFGGLVWMYRGAMLCAARHDGIIIRVGKTLEAWALAFPDVVPMQSGKRKMGGWVRLGASASADDDLRRALLARAVQQIETF